MALLNNLSSYWSLEDDAATTTVLDELATYNLTSSTNTEDMTTTGKVSNCLNFVKVSSQYLERDAGFLASDKAGTISFWVYLDADTAGTDQRLLSFTDKSTDSQTYLIIDFDDSEEELRILLKIDGTDAWKITYSADTNFARFVGLWKHIVIRHDGTTHYLYIDGADVTSIKTSTSLTKWFKDLREATNAMDTFTVGAWYNNNSRSSYFDGKIDEIGIWDRALTADEITNLYNLGKGFAYPFSTRGGVQGETGGIGTAAIATRYPVTIGITAGTTKQTGEQMNLIPKSSTIFFKDKTGVGL